ncbi:unnamed protein product, partial [Meganyctiphanes norvegica]
AKSCNNPFITIGEHCVFFGTFNLNQEDSKDFCNSLNGRLLQIDSAQQFRDLTDYINNSNIPLGSYWIDGSDDVEEGRWLYSNGKKEGQLPYQDVDLNCIGIGPEEYYYMTDRNCNDSRFPLCLELEPPKVPNSLTTEHCDGLGTLTNSTGILYSPGWPGTYSSDTNCYWEINLPDADYIRISFVSFDTEEYHDILEIREQITNDVGDILGTYNGRNKVFPDILSKHPRVLLEFHSDYSEQYDGFELHWRSEQANTSCVEEYSSTDGQIFSPGFPKDYFPNLDCQYIITTDEDKILRLTTSFFDTESDDDYLQVYDGGDSSAPLLMNLSGIQHNVPVISSNGNQLFITFNTDNDFSVGGFDMSWTSEKACPVPFITVGSMCLRFLFGDFTFGQATVSCVSEGGTLATIRSAEQLRDFFLYVNQLGIADADYWLGGSDVQSEGIWLWQDGTIIPMGTPFWGTLGSNAQTQVPTGGTQDNCLALMSVMYFFFSDRDCTNQYKAVCMYQKQS